jgi:hypothetical protein
MKQRVTNCGKPFAEEFLYREYGAVSVLSQRSKNNARSWAKPRGPCSVGAPCPDSQPTSATEMPVSPLSM